MFDFEKFLSQAYEGDALKGKLMDKLADIFGASEEELNESLNKINTLKLSFDDSQIFRNEEEFDDYVHNLSQMGPADFARMYAALSIAFGNIAQGCRQKARDADSEQAKKEWEGTVEWVDSLCTESFSLLVRAFPATVLSNLFDTEEHNDE